VIHINDLQTDAQRKHYIEAKLNTELIGKQLHYYRSITSTMDVARLLARSGALEGTVVITDEQQSGRGRLNRTWISPGGVLAFSVILYPSLQMLPNLIMIASVAVSQTIAEQFHLNARIKWPNDVLIEGKKVCGILIESELKGNVVNFSSIGIGINVNYNPIGHPLIGQAATCLSHECGYDVNKDDVACAVFQKFDELYLKVRAGGSVFEDWRDSMKIIGKAIRVKTGRTVVEGVVAEVTTTGNLLLRQNDDTMYEVIVGDVTVIKP